MKHNWPNLLYVILCGLVVNGGAAACGQGSNGIALAFEGSQSDKNLLRSMIPNALGNPIMKLEHNVTPIPADEWAFHEGKNKDNELAVIKRYFAENYKGTKLILKFRLEKANSHLGYADLRILQVRVINLMAGSPKLLRIADIYAFPDDLPKKMPAVVRHITSMLQGKDPKNILYIVDNTSISSSCECFVNGILELSANENLHDVFYVLAATQQQGKMIVGKKEDDVLQFIYKENNRDVKDLSLKVKCNLALTSLAGRLAGYCTRINAYQKMPRR